MRVKAHIIVLIFVMLATSACAGTKQQASATPKEKAAALELPSQILGLLVRQEDISKEIGAVRSATYFSSVALYTLREGELMQASLQVARFNNLAKPASERFRRQVIGLMGTGSPEELRIGDRKVYLSAGKQQVVYAWFEGNGFYVLTERRAYPFRRGLLRKLLTLQEPV